MSKTKKSDLLAKRTRLIKGFELDISHAIDAREKQWQSITDSLTQLAEELNTPRHGSPVLNLLKDPAFQRVAAVGAVSMIAFYRGFYDSWKQLLPSNQFAEMGNWILTVFGSMGLSAFTILNSIPWAKQISADINDAIYKGDWAGAKKCAAAFLLNFLAASASAATQIEQMKTGESPYLIFMIVTCSFLSNYANNPRHIRNIHQRIDSLADVFRGDPSFDTTLKKLKSGVSNFDESGGDSLRALFKTHYEPTSKHYGKNTLTADGKKLARLWKEQFIDEANQTLDAKKSSELAIKLGDVNIPPACNNTINKIAAQIKQFCVLYEAIVKENISFQAVADQSSDDAEEAPLLPLAQADDDIEPDTNHVHYHPPTKKTPAEKVRLGSLYLVGGSMFGIGGIMYWTVNELTQTLTKMLGLPAATTFAYAASIVGTSVNVVIPLRSFNMIFHKVINRDADSPVDNKFIASILIAFSLSSLVAYWSYQTTLINTGNQILSSCSAASNAVNVGISYDVFNDALNLIHNDDKVIINRALASLPDDWLHSENHLTGEEAIAVATSEAPGLNA